MMSNINEETSTIKVLDLPVTEIPEDNARNIRELFECLAVGKLPPILHPIIFGVSINQDNIQPK